MVVSTTKQVKIPVTNTCNSTSFVMQMPRCKIWNITTWEIIKRRHQMIKFLSRVYLNGHTKTFHPLTESYKLNRPVLVNATLHNWPMMFSCKTDSFHSRCIAYEKRRQVKMCLIQVIPFRGQKLSAWIQQCIMGWHPVSSLLFHEQDFGAKAT